MRELAAQRAAWSGCAKHPARALATLLLLLTCWPTQLECKQSAPAVEAAPAAPPPLPSPTVAGGAELATGSPGTISQQQVYRSPDGNGTEAVLAPNVAVAGDVVAETTAETVQACSAACRAAGANCTVFAYCDSPGGCSDGAGGDMAFQQCRFLDIGCNPGTRPPVVAAGPAVTVTSGFPAVPVPIDVYGFTEADGEGILGGDFACPLSKLPDRCAFTNIIDALFMCTTLTNPSCRAVVYYANGTDGCGAPISVLKSVGLADENAFVSPGVATLQQSEAQPPVFSRLYDADGAVVGVPEGELSDAAVSIPANSSTYLGCIEGAACIMDGVVVGRLDGVPTPEECCRRCRASLADGGGQCNVWTHCGVDRQGGCRYESGGIKRQFVSLAPSQCELRFQELAAVTYGWPAALIAKGDGVPFTCGAPLMVWGPEVPGYERMIGKGLYTHGRYNCTGSKRPEMQECVLPGTVEELGQHCRDDPACVAFTLKPGGALKLTTDIGIFKDDASPEWVILNPTAVTYLLPDRNGGGGLSAGAIAGIAVGCAAAAVALAGAAWWLLRRRGQQRGAVEPASPKKAGGGLDSTASSMEAGRGPDGELAAVGSPDVLAVSVPQADSSLVSPFSASMASPFGGSSSSRQTSPAISTSGSASVPGKLSLSGTREDTARSSALLPGLASQRSGAALPLNHHHQQQQQQAWVARPPLAPQLATTSSHMSRLQTPDQGAQQQRQPFPGGRHVSFQLQPAPSAATAGTSVASLAPSSVAPSRGAASAAGERGGLASSPEQGSAVLHELIAHVEEQERGASTSGDSGGALEPAHQPVSVEELPPRLREWVVDPAEVTYLRWPDGKLREIGAGASATVFKVMLHGEVVAAKTMDIGRSRSVQEAFLNEALRLHALRHPNVVAFYGMMLKGGKGTVLMELCEGKDLHSALEVTAAGTGQRLFGWYRRGRRVAFDIAKALNYLHTRGIVHMDVKSSNVLLTASGTAKLADVAFSRALDHTFLSDLPLIGTFAWIAPEVLLGGRQCTQAVDIYSFGVVLWEIVTGDRPQRGNMRMPRVPDECPQAVSDLIMECLSESPADRPTSQELLRRLGELMERTSQDNPARRPSPAPASPAAAAATTAAAAAEAV